MYNVLEIQDTPDAEPYPKPKMVLIDCAEMLHAMRYLERDYMQEKARLSAIAIARCLGSATMDPALDSEGRSIDHTNCANDAKNDVENACDSCSRNSPVVKHGLCLISRGIMKNAKAHLRDR
jgi:hypothetical protein